MSQAGLIHQIEEGLRSFQWFDPHTHLDALHLGARGLHDVLLYHMLLSDLKSAGLKNNARLSEHPDEEEVSTRVESALPFLPKISNTSCAWGARIILDELYGWKEPVRPDNWRRLHDCIRERSGDGVWHRELMQRAGIARALTEYARRHDGRADDLLQYCYELAFFSRAKEGVYDIPLQELERATSTTVRTPQDADEAIAAYVAGIPSEVLSTAQHLSTGFDYRAVSRAEMAAALRQRKQAGPSECDTYASYLLRSFLAQLQRRGSIVFQFSLGAEPTGEESYSLLRQETLIGMQGLLRDFPDLHFQVFLASAHANQAICSLARQHSNLSVAGYWWHNFFPGFIAQVIEQRLDMLAASKQIGFFSDAYCLEWQYAKAVMVRKLYARVLARKVELGQYGVNFAIELGRQTLRQSAEELLGMRV